MKKYFCKPVTSKGQAVVEFTLVFVLLLAISWIPADFGLAFFTGQLAQNASREGARLAAATNPFNVTDIQTQVSNRISRALLTNTSINVTPPTCDPTLGMKVVSVGVSGDYNFHFYQLLRLLGLPAPNSLTISRTTTMRYEHAFSC
jgi:Flp pilus assembly protein TadG